MEWSVGFGVGAFLASYIGGYFVDMAKAAIQMF
jgi:hypothetical protein